MKTLKNFNFKNKVVLLRADLNSDVKNKKVLISERIKESAKTIKKLKKQKGKVIVLSHQGRPGKSNFLSLRQHCKLLNKFVKIKFVPDILGKKAEKEIKNMKKGDAILLENIRKEKDEFKPGKNNKIVNFFVPLIDIYINDSFSVCHRNQASIVLFPKYVDSGAGLLLEKEINALKKIKFKNCLYILGGAKPEDNIKLLKKRNKVLAGGIFGQMCVIVRGHNLGKNNEKTNKKIIKDYEKIIGKLKNFQDKIIVPEDYAVEINNKRKEINLKDFPTDYVIYDIGKKTQEKFCQEIEKATSIYMKGPVGNAGDQKFGKGTEKLLKAISKNKGFSLIGGGHLSDALNKSKISKKKFNHISLSGGALLNYLAGEKLPGLEVLNKVN